MALTCLAGSRPFRLESPRPPIVPRMPIIYLYARLRKSAPLCGFGCAQSVEFDGFNGTSHVFRKPFHRPPDVVAALHGVMIIMRHDLVRFLDRDVRARC